MINLVCMRNSPFVNSNELHRVLWKNLVHFKLSVYSQKCKYTKFILFCGFEADRMYYLLICVFLSFKYFFKQTLSLIRQVFRFENDTD